MTRVKRSTCQSKDTSANRGSSAGPRTVRSFSPANARPIPPSPPRSPRSRLSFRNSRAMRDWPAPMAVRTAISRSRPSARTRNRFATLAQAMRRIIAHCPKEYPEHLTHVPDHVHLEGPNSGIKLGAFENVQCDSAGVLLDRKWESSGIRRRLACSTVTPGFRRAKPW